MARITQSNERDGMILSALKTLARDLVISALVFSLLAIFFIGSMAVSVGFSVQEAVFLAIRDFLPWVVFTPVLFRMVYLFPIERESWPHALVIQGLGAVGVIILSAYWADLLMPLSRGPGPMPPHPPGDMHGEMPGQVAFLQWLGPLLFRVPIYFAVLGVAHAFYFSRRARERERRALGLESSLAKARLHALRMQLHPHFLFNSLNAIAELTHKNPDLADEMLVALADFLRATLEMSDDQFISLKSEIHFINLYLAIEKIRLAERLRTEFEIEPEAEAAAVPPLLLQPLVENAVRHGLEPKQQPGLLKIRAVRVGDQLVLKVSDDGVGVKKGAEIQEGIGISNTRNRLTELFGPKGQLAFQFDAGFSVEITMPFRTQ